MPVFALDNTLRFPPVTYAEPDGLLAVGGDLNADRLALAYQKGIFPWYSEGEPILWYSPDPRFVLFPSDLYISSSMRKLMRKGIYKVTFNQDFKGVIENCAAVEREGQDGTWITADMIQAYLQLHEAGYAQSTEVWNAEGHLVGGIYGVKIGRFFAGESMFSLESNTSKIALIQTIQHWQPLLVDCQVHTEHLESMGAKMIERSAYLQLLKESISS
jgi:leucyl/phenylalanyl-tRNA--protein transferase